MVDPVGPDLTQAGVEMHFLPISRAKPNRCILRAVQRAAVNGVNLGQVRQPGCQRFGLFFAVR